MNDGKGTLKCTILSYAGNTNAQKAEIAAQYAGVEIDYPSTFKMGTDNKTPEFLKKNPNGQVPSMDTPDGPLWESNTLARYVVRKGHDHGLYGANEYQACQVDQWIDWIRSKLENPGSDWVGPVFGYREANAEKRQKAMEDIAKALAILDGHLADKVWIVGNRVTLADIVMCVAISSPIKFVMDSTFLKPFPHFVAWFHRCITQKEFKAVMGEVKLCEKELPPGALKRS